MAITAGASNSVWQRRKIEVPAGQTIDVDTLALDTFRGAKYIISTYSVDDDVYASQEVLVTRRASDSLSWTRYAKVGDSINYSAQFVVSGTDVVHRFTNDESFNIIVSLYRLTMN
jgi:hypothetical protein